MPHTYHIYAGCPPEPALNRLLDLLTHVFTNQSREEWLADLAAKATYLNFLTLLALDGDRVIGCKLGYEWESDEPGRRTFYSWLGSVDPAYSGQGVAGELMRLQHEACQRAGYVMVRTHTYNQWRDMLILNLRHGFQIIGTQPGKHGPMIILEKGCEGQS